MRARQPISPEMVAEPLIVLLQKVHDLPHYRMLQPTGPQEGADVLVPWDGAALPRKPNTESAFRACRLPHRGQTSSILSAAERTSLSYRSPQSWHTYS